VKHRLNPDPTDHDDLDDDQPTDPLAYRAIVVTLLAGIAVAGIGHAVTGNPMWWLAAAIAWAATGIVVAVLIWRGIR